MRQRGTALVETKDGILVALEANGSELLLPGGGVEQNETGLEAAVRELREEACLEAILAVPLFCFQSKYNLHFVCYIKAAASPKLGHNVKYLGGYQNKHLTLIACKPGFETMSASQVSPSARAIIKLFYNYRREHSAWFDAVDTQIEFKQYTYTDADRL